MSAWRELGRRIRRGRDYRELADAERAAVVGLPVRAAAVVFELLAEDREGAQLVVVPSENEVLAWTEAAGLLRARGRSRLIPFPSPALTPYQQAEASLLVRAQESTAYDALLGASRVTVVCTPRALFHRLARPDAFLGSVVELEVGGEVSPEDLLPRLLAHGYRRSDLVAAVGAVAQRGGVFDLFGPGEPRPARLDLFGDTVESIHRFDPSTQRSEEPIESLRIRPLTPFVAGPERAAGLSALLLEERGGDLSDQARAQLEEMAAGEPFDGWEKYLPLLEPSTSLGEVMADAPVVVVDPERVSGEVERHAGLLWEEYRRRCDDGEIAAEPERLTVPADQVLELVERAAFRVGGTFDRAPGDRASGGRRLRVDFGAVETDVLVDQLPRFPREVETAAARGDDLWLVARSERHEALRQTLGRREIDWDGGAVRLIDGELARGFRLPHAGLVLYGEGQLFRQRLATSRRRRRMGPFVSGLRDLRVGEFVVHEDHGIGQFLGLKTLDGPSGEGPAVAADPLRQEQARAVEVMELLYSSGRTLLLPLTRLDEMERYSGIDGIAPRLDQLGGSSWAKKKSRIRRSLKAIATDLLKLYAERRLAQAVPMDEDSDRQLQFESAFPYEETPDQLEAVRTIKEDLARDRPMDRLLCGDVGFGKTEVAMRAAFKAVDNGLQVAVLAPTTILADQHLRVFRRRFQGFGVEIEMVSRFRSAAQVRKIRERLAAGEIHILIGTHRLLSRDIDLPCLGLVIIDEEQRFGVAQKERLRELKRNVHVLAMSATPVPRTLQLSLAGVRDLSLIESPPRDRMAVETRVLPFSGDLVREAIEFEVERGGQVFYVYNRVEDIEGMLRYLRELVPGLRITVGHGQMDEAELSRRMRAFTSGEVDLLLATTIIENGIDIPNVNTMLVHRADRFGLAQLYQLRGRVGRSDQLGYCYLLAPPDTVLSEEARKRLVAIREFTELGAGFRIAARDLEIRGAGNLLGAEQSGHIAEVGIETYMKMLEQTIAELRGEAPAETPSASISLPTPMSIPEDYISEISLRLEIYRRLADADEEPDTLLGELRDRFGPPPEAVHALVRGAELKRVAESLGVQSIAHRKERLTIRLRRDAKVDVDGLIRFVSEREGAGFTPDGVLTLGGIPGPQALEVTLQLLQLLSGEPLSGLAASETVH
ncbi:MAG: transcription-repair coupling factor [Acidobacteria bacterium]|nr:transcription-repair coupling factor [Acidobacteriota bacterium]